MASKQRRPSRLSGVGRTQGRKGARALFGAQLTAPSRSLIGIDAKLRSLKGVTSGRRPAVQANAARRVGASLIQKLKRAGQF